MIKGFWYFLYSWTFYLNPNLYQVNTGFSTVQDAGLFHLVPQIILLTLEIFSIYETVQKYYIGFVKKKNIRNLLKKKKTNKKKFGSTIRKKLVIAAQDTLF